MRYLKKDLILLSTLILFLTQNININAKVIYEYINRETDTIECINIGIKDYILYESDNINYNVYKIILNKSNLSQRCKMKINSTGTCEVMLLFETANEDEDIPQININLYDKDGSTLEKSTSQNQNTFSGHFTIDSKGEYELEIGLIDYKSDNDVTIRMYPTCTTKEKKKINIYDRDGSTSYLLTSLNNSEIQYIKLVLKEGTVITPYVQDMGFAFAMNYSEYDKYYKNRITLCDSNKKPIGNTNNSINIKDFRAAQFTSIDMINEKFPNNTTRYALEKGTYYLKVEAQEPAPENLVLVKVEVFDINENSGSKKSKAKEVSIYSDNINQGIISSTKNGDWYKVNLTYFDYLQLNIVDFSTSGKVKFVIYDNDNNKIETTNTYIKETILGKSYIIKSKEKLKKGKYYIEVLKTKDNSTSMYSFKLQR